ncbi:small membrane protein YoaI [Salmonella enterica subsp. enterica serovar Infantis]
MYDPPCLEALMITASFFALFIIIGVSVFFHEGGGD